MNNPHTYWRELATLLALIFILSAGIIWVRTSTVKATYAYVQKDKEFRKLEGEIQANRVHWLKLTTPKRLEAMAKGLGLRPPEMNQMLKYEPQQGFADHTLQD